MLDAGFTALAEHLCSCGSDGMEQLVVVINDYFSRLIRIVVDQCGGDILHFVGDALVVFFRHGKTEQRAMTELMESLVFEYLKDLEAKDTEGAVDDHGCDESTASVPDTTASRDCTSSLIVDSSGRSFLKHLQSPEEILRDIRGSILSLDEAAIRSCVCASQLMKNAASYKSGDISLVIHIGRNGCFFGVFFFRSFKLQ